MKKCIVLFTFVMISILLPAQHKGIPFAEGTWAEICSRSVKENKPIFVDCFTTWCGPCKWLAKNVFPKDEVGEYYAANYICVEIDMEKGEGPELAKKWQIRAYPTLIFCDAKGEVLHRSCGVDYRDDFYKDFIQLGKDAKDPEKQFIGFKKKVEAGNADSKTTATYIWLMARGYMPYADELTKYWTTQKDEELLKRYNWELIYNLNSSYESREFKFLMANREKYEKLYTVDSVGTKIGGVYANALLMASKDDEKFEKIKTELRSTGIRDPDKIILHAEMYKYKNNSYIFHVVQ